MHKYQIAVKSSMDSYVRNAVSTETTSESTQQPTVKRKWEDSGGAEANPSATSSPVVEKKAKRLDAETAISMASCYHDGYLFRSVPSNNPPQTKAVTPAGHFMEARSETKNVPRHDNFCWVCHIDTPPVGSVLLCHLLRSNRLARFYRRSCLGYEVPRVPEGLSSTLCPTPVAHPSKVALHRMYINPQCGEACPFAIGVGVRTVGDYAQLCT